MMSCQQQSEPSNKNEAHHNHTLSLAITRLDLNEIKDRLDVMRRQEGTTYSCSDYLASRTTSSSSNRCNAPSPVSPLGVVPPNQDQTNLPIDEACRMKMSQWCFQVIDFAKFRRDTVSISMSLLDRFLCSHLINDAAREAMNCRKAYQLASMTTLYMAIKIFEPVTMEVAVFAQLSRGCYTPNDFISMEQRILAALNWRMNGPTTINFVELYLSVLPLTLSTSLEKMMPILWARSKYQCELACLDYEFVTRRPSDIALASIINSIQQVPTAIFSEVERSTYFSRLESLCQPSFQYGTVNAISKKLSMMENNHQSKAERPMDILKPREHYHIPNTFSPSSSHKHSGQTSPNCVSG